MALQSTDVFVVQSETDKKPWKLSFDKLSQAIVNDGQINISGGDGIVATGDNATANQAINTTRTLSVDEDWLVEFFDPNRVDPLIGNGKIKINGGDGIVATGSNGTVNQFSDTTKTIAVDTTWLGSWIDANKPANDGQINFNAGDGLSQTGNNATANQLANTTKSFAVKTDGPSIAVSSDGIKVVAIDGGVYA